MERYNKRIDLDVHTMMMMGIVKKPEYDMYWTTDHMYATPIYSRVMSRTRFKEIRKIQNKLFQINSKIIISWYASTYRKY